MDRFSSAHKKTKDILSSQKFAADWQKHFDAVKNLFTDTGLDSKYSPQLTKFRADLFKKYTTQWAGKKMGEPLLTLSTNSDGSGKKRERAASVKLLKHLYFVQKKGAQDLWIYSPPKAYAKWIYEEFDGLGDTTLKSKLSEEDEVYNEDNKKVMGEGLIRAHALTQKVQMMLADQKESTDTVVKRWFDDGTASTKDLATIKTTLLNGFKKIVNMANSNQVIFSDEPGDRNYWDEERKVYNWEDFAFIYKSEKMPVIYIQNGWLKAANSGKLDRCARTIIHELSHKAVGTNDKGGYGWQGLKPGGKNMTRAKAINNADSWAYFAMDLNGALTESERTEALV